MTCSQCIESGCSSCTTVYGEASKATVILNDEDIRRCNSQSMYNAGNIIIAEAQSTYEKFFSMFPIKDDYTEQQKAYLADRAVSWKDLVENAYSEDLRRRADIVPVNVAGASNYPAERMNKRMDNRMSRQQEWSEKMDKFVSNTSKGLIALTPSETIIEEYRTGKNSTAIASDDPLASYKLSAKLEFLEDKQKRMKAANAHYRKHKTMRGYANLSDEVADRLDERIKGDYSWCQAPYPPYELQNNNANIKTVRERLARLTSHREEQRISGYAFDGGKVVANYDIDRLQVFFDEKPDSDTRAEMKSNGFRWAPSEEAWQRQLTANALYAAKKLFKEVI